RERALGRSLADLIIPQPLREAHKAGLARYLATGEQKVIGKRIELTAVRASGEEFPVELAITVMQAGEERLFTAHLRDITERKRHREPCSVPRLVDGVNATFEHVASGKGLLLTRRIDPALWAAHLIDPSRLRQILTNLVSNAIKFTHAGTVTLEVKVLETKLENDPARQKLCFSVHDSGIGMSAETQRRLFEPFQQGESDTRRRYE